MADFGHKQPSPANRATSVPGDLIKKFENKLKDFNVHIEEMDKRLQELVDRVEKAEKTLETFEVVEEEVEDKPSKKKKSK